MNSEMPETEAQDAAALIVDAFDMVTALCKPKGSEGSREWEMSIPARPDHAPDLVIAAGLSAGASALEEVERLREENGRLRAMVEGMKKDLAYIRVTETDVRLALDALPRWCWTMSPTKADIHAVAHRLTTRINSRAILSTTPTDTGEADGE